MWRNLKFYIFIMVAIFLFILYGCAPKPTPPISIQDNPYHHYLYGMELIEKGEIASAEAKFNRAIALDPNFARAYAGKALVLAIKAENMKDLKKEAVKIDKAILKVLKKAEKNAKKPTDKFAVYVTAIRVYTHAKPKNWLSQAVKYYEKALELENVSEKDLIYYKSKASLYYFMGKAYLEAYEFRKAEDMFAKVLEYSPGKWHSQAEILYRKVQKILRAAAQYTLTDVAKKIAVKDKIGRADVAVLLVNELHLDKFFTEYISSTNSRPQPEFIPADVLNHIFKDEILTVISWKIRGLEPVYDPVTKAYLFKPDEPLTRKELAFILEDLLIKLTGDQTLATKFFGQTYSPYPDVPPSAPYFNAVMNVVTRGLMEADLSGAFRPNDYVDGAELLLAIMRLRNILYK